ncbi:hypothetical protein [Desulfosporosinus sp. OT]|uniref:hypothetical protein n=1 Tax=Desulfosporosinus sp. OT TaxID=913865 RepID=UPI000223A95A|nr:hypothetical protein [Desulfosporosinus sp. OT]EGW37722.1 hypothetical protein DOT_4354 [Desulfosporosinus sp. OT]
MVVVLYRYNTTAQWAGIQCEGGTGCRNAYNWVMTDIVAIKGDKLGGIRTNCIGLRYC